MIYENSSAIFTLIGTMSGAAIVVLRDYLNNRSKIRLEKVRLYDKERRDAHKRLFVFSQKLSNRVYPLASGKQEAFVDAMRLYLGKHRSDLLWFSSQIFDIMCKLEDYYLCLTEPDLREETQEEMERYFHNDRLFDTLNTLTKEARKNVTQEY